MHLCQPASAGSDTLVLPVQVASQKQQMAHELAERGQQAAELQQQLSASHAKLALMTQRAELAMQRAARNTAARPALPPRPGPYTPDTSRPPSATLQPDWLPPVPPQLRPAAVQLPEPPDSQVLAHSQQQPSQPAPQYASPGPGSALQPPDNSPEAGAASQPAPKSDPGGSTALDSTPGSSRSARALSHSPSAGAASFCCMMVAVALLPLLLDHRHVLSSLEVFAPQLLTLPHWSRCRA